MNIAMVAGIAFALGAVVGAFAAIYPSHPWREKYVIYVPKDRWAEKVWPVEPMPSLVKGGGTVHSLGIAAGRTLYVPGGPRIQILPEEERSKER